jgi:hypothetical protein
LISSEREIEFCVGLLFELTSLVPLTPTLAASIGRSGIAYASLSLLLFILSDAQVSNLLNSLESFFEDYFDIIGSFKAADLFHQVILGYFKFYEDGSSYLSEQEIDLMIKVSYIIVYSRERCIAFPH